MTAAIPSVLLNLLGRLLHARYFSYGTVTSLPSPWSLQHLDHVEGRVHGSTIFRPTLLVQMRKFLDQGLAYSQAQPSAIRQHHSTGKSIIAFSVAIHLPPFFMMTKLGPYEFLPGTFSFTKICQVAGTLLS